MKNNANWFIVLMLFVIFGLGVWTFFKLDGLEKSSTQEDSTSTATAISLLYVQNAQSGTLEKTTGDLYKLTLNNVSPQTILFADRPSRISGQMGTADFVNDDIFKDENDLPNAALDIFDAKNTEDVIIMELSNPAYDEASKTMIYTVKLLSNIQSDLLANFEERSDNFVPTNFDAVTLFIDSGTLNDQCNSGDIIPCHAGKCDNPIQICVLKKGIYQCLDDVPY